MVNVPKEKSFPRGGREEQFVAPKRRNPDLSTNKFSVPSKKNNQTGKKTFKAKESNQNTNEEDEPTFNVGATQSQYSNLLKPFYLRPYSGQLKYDSIVEGMLILGSVYKIETSRLYISLPGNCIGHVPIRNISEPYCQFLSSSLKDEGRKIPTHHLEDMFYIGQHVVTKVVRKHINDGTDTKVVLTLSPQAIHLDCSIKDVVAQSVFTAAVVSVEEKVYVMDLGIKSVRAFLKRENAEQFKNIWNKDKELRVGQLVRCMVMSVTSENNLATVTLTANPELVKNASSSEIGSRIQGILPGMLFNVTVARPVFPSGIQVQLSKNVVGYVPPHHLPNAFKDPEHYKVGSMHPARVLYISQSGAIFFTMNTNICIVQPPVSPFKTLKAGYVAKNAVVCGILDEGLIVKLTNPGNVPLKGVIPFSHLNHDEQPLDEDSELPVSMQIANEFPIGTKLTCRVMDYCYMDQYYLCTMNPSLMKEMYLHPSSLKVAAIVSCIIKEMAANGIVVTLGRESPVSGFVPSLHTSDVPVVNLAKRFHVGQTCTAKVLKSGNSIHLTMKQSLIQSTSLLTNYDMAEVGKKYLGTVVRRGPIGIMVEFFSTFTSWVKQRDLSKKLMEPSDIEKSFYLGQVVNCTVIQKYTATRTLRLGLVHTSESTDDDVAKSGKSDCRNKERKVTLKKTSENGCEVANEVNSKDVVDTKSEELVPKAGRQKKKKLKAKQKANSESIICDTSSNEIAPKKHLKKSNEIVGSSEDLVLPKKKQKGINVEDQKSETPSVSVKKSKKMKQTCQSGVEEEAEPYLLTNSNLVETKLKEGSSSKKSRKADKPSLNLKEAKKKRKLSTGSVDAEDCGSTSSTKGSKKSRKTLTNTFEVIDADVKQEVCSDAEFHFEQKAFHDQSKDGVMVKTEMKDSPCYSDLQYVDGSFEIKTEEDVFLGKEIKEGTPAITKKTKKLNTSHVFKNEEQLEPSDEGYITSDMPVAVKTNGSEKKKRKQKKRASTEQEISVTKNSYEQSGDAQKTQIKTMDSDSAEEVETNSSKKPVELPSLSVTTGFVWDATPNFLPAVAKSSGDDENSSDEESVQNKKVKRSRQAIVAEKRLQAQLEEARLRSVEQRLMDPEQLPQTADEFDRLVLSSPDNSMVWLQYMAYHIQATEIEKARSVAQRALKTISFREEQEKLNVWVALLNLENLYGTSESVKNTLEEAVRLNDPYKVYTQMLQIYADSHKLQDGDELIAAMIKKFKTVKDMWINVATFYMKSGQMVKARALLQRALTSLEKKEHVSVISQFALLENKLGSKERAQTLMEQILTSYPKRVDVWSVYVDMLVKSNLISMARHVLERAVAQRLHSHKMKALFKKFLTFEEAHGNEEGANRVRQLALEFVESATNAE